MDTKSPQVAPLALAPLLGENRYTRVQRMLAQERADYESSWLMSERMLHICHAIEASPASEQLTKCSVLAAQLRRELELYEQTRPMTPEETARIQAAWKSFSAVAPNIGHQPTPATPAQKRSDV